ncbi:MAG: hypothetical protein KHZ78_05380 [Peptoniphilus sp. oral taxon 375]|nr:hypothetical protein [Peptoniphilus sp. oral taxon 375]
MKYLEVKEFIESLPKSPLVEYSTGIGIDTEKLSAEPVIKLVRIEASFSPEKDNPYQRCFLEISKEGSDCDYGTFSRFDFEPNDEEREELANKVFRMMKEFVCKQMMKE